MKLWLSKNSEISIREQLTRQIILAIVSGDLRAGERLPSVRELALRHKIHPNTASAAYHWLEENGWVTARMGSGVYVREISQVKIDEAEKVRQNELDAMILSFLNETRQCGFDSEQIKSRLKFWLQNKKPRRIFVLENDAELGRILALELAEHFSVQVFTTDFSGIGKNGFGKNSLIVSLSDWPAGAAATAPFLKIKLNSAQESMRGKEKPAETDLIGIASHWEKFLRWSQTMLVAVGISEENLVVRDTKQDGWQKGLESCSFVITDSLTAQQLPGKIEKRVFKLISEESIARLQNHFK